MRQMLPTQHVHLRWYMRGVPRRRPFWFARSAGKRLPRVAAGTRPPLNSALGLESGVPDPRCHSRTVAWGGVRPKGGGPGGAAQQSESSGPPQRKKRSRFPNQVFYVLVSKKWVFNDFWLFQMSLSCIGSSGRLVGRISPQVSSKSESVRVCLFPKEVFICFYCLCMFLKKGI